MAEMPNDNIQIRNILRKVLAHEILDTCDTLLGSHPPRPNEIPEETQNALSELQDLGVTGLVLTGSATLPEMHSKDLDFLAVGLNRKEVANAQEALQRFITSLPAITVQTGLNKRQEQLAKDGGVVFASAKRTYLPADIDTIAQNLPSCLSEEEITILQNAPQNKGHGISLGIDILTHRSHPEMPLQAGKYSNIRDDDGNPVPIGVGKLHPIEEMANLIMAMQSEERYQETDGKERKIRDIYRLHALNEAIMQDPGYTQELATRQLKELLEPQIGKRPEHEADRLLGRGMQSGYIRPENFLPLPLNEYTGSYQTMKENGEIPPTGISLTSLAAEAYKIITSRVFPPQEKTISQTYVPEQRYTTPRFQNILDRYQTVQDILEDPELDNVAYAAGLETQEMANLLLRAIVTREILAQPLSVTAHQADPISGELAELDLPLHHPGTSVPLKLGDVVTFRAGNGFSQLLTHAYPADGPASHLLPLPQDPNQFQKTLQELTARGSTLTPQEIAQITSLATQPNIPRTVSDFDLAINDKETLQRSMLYAMREPMKALVGSFSDFRENIAVSVEKFWGTPKDSRMHHEIVEPAIDASTRQQLLHKDIGFAAAEHLLLHGGEPNLDGLLLYSTSIPFGGSYIESDKRRRDTIQQLQAYPETMIMPGSEGNHFFISQNVMEATRERLGLTEQQLNLDFVTTYGLGLSIKIPVITQERTLEPHHSVEAFDVIPDALPGPATGTSPGAVASHFRLQCGTLNILDLMHRMPFPGEPIDFPDALKAEERISGKRSPELKALFSETISHLGVDRFPADMPRGAVFAKILDMMVDQAEQDANRQPTEATTTLLAEVKALRHDYDQTLQRANTIDLYDKIGRAFAQSQDYAFGPRPKWKEATRSDGTPKEPESTRKPIGTAFDTLPYLRAIDAILESPDAPPDRKEEATLALQAMQLALITELPKWNIHSEEALENLANPLKNVTPEVYLASLKPRLYHPERITLASATQDLADYDTLVEKHLVTPVKAMGQRLMNALEGQANIRGTYPVETGVEYMLYDLPELQDFVVEISSRRPEPLREFIIDLAEQVRQSLAFGLKREARVAKEVEAPTKAQSWRQHLDTDKGSPDRQGGGVGR